MANFQLTMNPIESPSITRHEIDKTKLVKRIVRLRNHDIVCTAMMAINILQQPAPMVANSLLLVDNPARLNITDE